MAEEARSMAGEMITHDAQATLLTIAEQYDHLAALADREEGRSVSASPTRAFRSRPA